MTLIEKFWDRVMTEPNSGCWLWMGKIKPNGYAIFNLGRDGDFCYAHRWSYEYFKCRIPSGLQIDHICRVRCCVNPDHLEAVTQTENILRSNSLSAHNARKTHCKHGHEFDEKNTWRDKNGNRSCRKCNARNQRNLKRRRLNAMAV